MKTNQEGRELRTFKVEFRAEGDKKLRGHAALFNVKSENLGGYKEVIAAGAFDGVLGDDVRMLQNHDENRVLGRTVSKTLSLSVDPTGLAFECSPPDTSYWRDLAISMDRGDVDQCSFAFRVAPNGSTWDEDEDGVPIRTVTKISRLYDTSVVTYPAYLQTSADFRSAADILSEHQPTPGQTAPPAPSGGVDGDLLRRKLELAFQEHL